MSPYGLENPTVSSIVLGVDDSVLSKMPEPFVDVDAPLDPAVTDELARVIDKQRSISTLLGDPNVVSNLSWPSSEKLIPFFQIDLREVPELRDTGAGREGGNRFILDRLPLRHAVAIRLLVVTGFLSEEQVWTPDRFIYDSFGFIALPHETGPMIAECFSAFSDAQGNPYLDGFILNHVNPQL